MIPCCNSASTAVQLHHKTHEEKARWKLHKETACYFEQILEAAPYEKNLETYHMHLVY